MKRIKDDFLEIITSQIALRNTWTVDIGAGEGMRSADIAKHCRYLIGVDPDINKVRQATKKEIPNASFIQGQAENLKLAPSAFDVVMFTLSFHHIPTSYMSQAIDEAVRVVRPNGHIIFLEPGTTGSFFEAEIEFDAGDGDERKEKVKAYEAMTTHPDLECTGEYASETVIDVGAPWLFQFCMHPKKNLENLESFLAKHANRLAAERRINIFRPRSRR